MLETCHHFHLKWKSFYHSMYTNGRSMLSFDFFDEPFLLLGIDRSQGGWKKSNSGDTKCVVLNCARYILQRTMQGTVDPWLLIKKNSIFCIGRDNRKMSSTTNNSLYILHYNDIYNIDANSSVEPIGGASRFSTAIKSFSHLNPLILFSGDAFSPSMCKI